MVELKGFGHFQHLVPVFTGAGKRRALRVTALHACGAANTEFFTETEQVPVAASTAWMMANEMMSWPLVFLSSRRFLLHYERVPPGGLAVRRHTPVEAADGPVGHLLAFVLQEPDHRLRNVIFATWILGGGAK